MKNLSTLVKVRQAIFVLAVLLLASQSATAQPAAGPGSRHHQNFIEELALDNEQEALWRAIRKDGRENRKAVRDLQQELQDLVHSDRYSDAEVQALAQRLGDAMAANIAARANAEHAFFQSLSAEQKEKFESVKHPRVIRFRRD